VSAAERLKDDRALQIQPDRQLGNIRLIMTDDRELPTNPDNLRPSEVPPMVAMPPSARLPALRPNPDSYAEWALSQLLARVRGLESDRGAMTMADFEAALDRNTQRILHETSADIGLIRSSITGLQQSVDALVTRIGNTETALDAGTKRFAAIDDELAAMRSQMSRLEQLRPHLERLEAAIEKMKLEGTHGAAETKAE